MKLVNIFLGSVRTKSYLVLIYICRYLFDIICSLFFFHFHFFTFEEAKDRLTDELFAERQSMPLHLLLQLRGETWISKLLIFKN